MDKPELAAILAEPAGPRLDAWTARWAMGWPEVDSESEKLKSEADGVAWSERWWPAGGAERHGREGWEEWSPSTPSAATWEVLRWLKTQVEELSLSITVRRGELEWGIFHYDGMEGEPIIDSCPAVAVCKAAILVARARAES